VLLFETLATPVPVDAFYPVTTAVAPPVLNVGELAVIPVIPIVVVVVAFF
jgi:hypothetical protein